MVRKTLKRQLRIKNPPLKIGSFKRKRFILNRKGKRKSALTI